MDDITKAYEAACKLSKEESREVTFEFDGAKITVRPIRLGKTVQDLRAENERLREFANLFVEVIEHVEDCCDCIGCSGDKDLIKRVEEAKQELEGKEQS